MDRSKVHTLFLDGKPYRNPLSSNSYQACTREADDNFNFFDVFDEQDAFLLTPETVFNTYTEAYIHVFNTWYCFEKQKDSLTDWGMCLFFLPVQPLNDDNVTKDVPLDSTTTYYQEHPSQLWYWIADTFAYTFD
jgi:hypothetical protein